MGTAKLPTDTWGGGSLGVTLAEEEYLCGAREKSLSSVKTTWVGQRPKPHVGVGQTSVTEEGTSFERKSLRPSEGEGLRTRKHRRKKEGRKLFASCNHWYTTDKANNKKRGGGWFHNQEKKRRPSVGPSGTWVAKRGEVRGSPRVPPRELNEENDE